MQGLECRNKCQRLHHLASVCRSGKPASTAATTDVDTATATAEASAFNGFIAPIVAAPPTSHSTLAPLVAHTSTDLPFILRPFKHYVNSPHFSEIVKPIHFKRHLLLQRHPGGKGQVLVLIHVWAGEVAFLVGGLDKSINNPNLLPRTHNLTWILLGSWRSREATSAGPPPAWSVTLGHHADQTIHGDSGTLQGWH